MAEMTPNIEPPNYGNVPPRLVWVNNRRSNKVIRNQDRGASRASKNDVRIPGWYPRALAAALARYFGGLSRDVLLPADFSL